MACRYRITIDGVRWRISIVCIDKVQGDLMAKEIQIDPARCSPALVAAEKPAIKGLCRTEIGHGQSQMERL